MKRTALSLTALLAALALTGCGGSESPQARDDLPAGVPSPSTTSTSTDVSTETPDETESADHSPADATTWPDDVEAPEQGGTYQAVVLASGTDADVRDAVDSASERGYGAGPSDVGCLDGVADQVDVDGLVAAVLFESSTDADAFAQGWTDEGLPVVGTAEVRTYCLD